MFCTVCCFCSYVPPENLFVCLVVFCKTHILYCVFVVVKCVFCGFVFFPFFVLYRFCTPSGDKRILVGSVIFRFPFSSFRAGAKKQKVRTKSKPDSVRTRYTPAVPPYLKRMTASSHRPPTRSVFLRENYVRNYFVRLGPRGPILSNTVSVGIPPSPTLYRSCVCFLPFNGL